MKKFDFCFYITETFIVAEEKAEIIKELEKRGYSCCAITSSEAGDEVMKERGITNFHNLEEISSVIKISDDELEDKIVEIEKIFGIANLRTEILTEKLAFQEKDEKKLIKKIICYLLGLKNLFENERVEVEYFIQGIAGLANNIAFYYFGKTNGEHVYHAPAPFNGLINFSSHHWGILEIDKVDLKPMTPREKEFISDYVLALKRGKKLNMPIPIELMNPHITKERFRLLWNLIKYRKKQNLPPLFIIKSFLIRYLRRLYVRKFYSKPVKGEKYIFFPLHFPFDSQLTEKAVPFITQEFVIEMVSRYLPFGYKLYVKEHPAAEGWFSVKMLNYINKIPNVRIVPPQLNPHDLIEKAEVICVINSTAGFESLLYQKPIITFGESLYSDKGVTLDVKNLYDLPMIINKAKNFKPDWEKILFLMNLWYKKSFLPTPEEIFSSTHEPSNEIIKVFCDSLLKYLETYFTFQKPSI